MRRVRTLVAGLVVVCALGGVVVAAVLAEGRPGSQSETHDGGAWLLNRGANVIGHVNRVVGELTGAVRFDSGEFDVEQSSDVILVHDRVASSVMTVDSSAHAAGTALSVPAASVSYAVPGGVVLYDPAALAVWRLAPETLVEVDELASVSTVWQGSDAGWVAVAPDGLIVAYDQGADSMTWLWPDGEIEVAESVGLTDVDLIDLTIVGRRAVVVVEGEILVGSTESFERYSTDLPIVVLQQSTDEEAAGVVGVTGDGVIIEVDLDSGAFGVVRDVGGGGPLQPIVHDGCVWTVMTAPSPAFHFCGEGTQLLDGAGSELRLRLVNDWVWVNDASRGNVWFVREDLTVAQISDWSSVLPSDADDDEDSNEDGDGREETVADPNAPDTADDVDKLDDDDQNESPIAEPDSVETRVDRPVLVDVLANDTDPDNDPLVVEAITAGVDDAGRTPEGALVSIRPGGAGTQVDPPAGFTGTLTFEYEIHDGRAGRARALVTVQVLGDDVNRPPVPTPDTAAVRRGASAAFNVLDNDTDPDGDSLFLLDVTEDGGTVVFGPDGSVEYRPDQEGGEGIAELEYTVSDERGETATGDIRVFVRPAESNQQPQARNDVAQTVVGKTVVLDVLANDADPDGDLLLAQSLVSPDNALGQASLSSEGVFVFAASAAGEYRFTYTVADNAASDPKTDEAQIHVHVDEVVANRPPVAVRDDVTLRVGESRLVRVLDNDGDPDGDVVGITGFDLAEGLDISEVPGIGFQVRPEQGAAPTVSFRYSISDGVAEPVSAVVVVAVVPGDPVDHPPVARPDVIDVRPGLTVQVPVLRNDYDPDGDPIAVVAVNPVGGDDATPLVAADGQSVLLTVGATQRFGFSFGYDIADEAGNRASSVVQVRIIPAGQDNRPPVAQPDVVRTVEGVPVVVEPLVNDSDPDGDPITVESIAQQPAHGTAEVLPGGTILYTPAGGFAGTDRFTYVVVDGYVPEARAIGEVLVGVMPLPPVNRAPTAIDDLEFPPVELGSAGVDLDVLANDSDPDGDDLTITEVSSPSVGELAISENGAFLVYLPPEVGDPREVAFSYSIADGRGGADSARVVLALAASQSTEPPVAVPDTVGPVRAGQQITFDPRLNDYDPDGPRSSLTVVPSPTDFDLTGDGQVSLLAPATSTQILYRVVDQDGLESDPATITVVVLANEAPQLMPLTVETAFETRVEVDVASAVADADGDELVFTIGSQSTGGQATVVPVDRPGFTVAFQPDGGFEGDGLFDFTVDDQNGHRVAGVVRVQVLPPDNRPPVAIDSAFEIEAGTATPIDLNALVDDPDLVSGDERLTFTIGSPDGNVAGLSVDPDSGVVTVDSDVDDGERTDGFDYTVTDQAGETASAHVDLAFTPAQFPAPVALADTAQTNQQQPVTIDPLANDVDNSPSDQRGDGLVITSVGVTPGGTTEIDADGQSIMFTPAAAFFGSTSFTYTVQDGRRLDGFQSDGVITVDVVGFPSQPLPPQVSSVGDGYVVLTWQAPAGNGAPVEDYEVRYAAGGATGSHTLGSPTTSYRWDGLTNGTSYTFTVIARNAAGDSPQSDASLPGIPDTPPEAPGAPTVAFGDEQLDVTWAAPPNRGTAIVDYQVEISGGAAEVYTTGGAVTTHTWTGLINGTNYQLRVRAKNNSVANDGWGAWSAWSTPEHPLTVPAAPAPVAIDRGDRQLIVSWPSPDNGGDPITLYEVQLEDRSGTSLPWVSVTPQGGSNTYTWPNLTNGVEYRAQVRAIIRDPLSTTASPGNWSQFLAACTVPDAPATPGVQRGDGQVTVTWSAPNDQGCPITGYTIQASNGATVAGGAGATDIVFPGLTNGTAYTVTVLATNVEGDGAASPSSASVTPAGVPFAPNLTSATATGAATVQLNWTAANPNGDPIVRYEVSVNGGAWANAGTGTSHTVGGLSQATNYSFVVRAVNGVGTGVASNSRAVRTWGPPSAPNPISASAGNGVISASWSAPAANGAAIIEYQIDWSTSGSRNGVNATQSGRSVNFSVSNGSTYRIWVRARNSVGWGAWSPASNAVTPTAPPTVSISWGSFGGAQGEPDCSSAACTWISASGSNFSANTTYALQCWERPVGGSWVVFYTRNVTTNGGGGVSLDPCYYGIPGRQVSVTINGVRSNALTR